MMKYVNFHSIILFFIVTSDLMIISYQNSQLKIIIMIQVFDVRSFESQAGDLM